MPADFPNRDAQISPDDAADPDAIPAEGHELFPLPEVFWRDDGDNVGTRDKITKIYVSKKMPDRQLSQIDWRPAEQLPDLKELELSYGPGTFCLLGRGEADPRLNLAKIYVTVGDVDDTRHGSRALLRHEPPRAPAPAFDVTRIAATFGALVTPLVTLYQAHLAHSAEERRADREAAERRAAEDRARDDVRQNTMMQIVTAALTARTDDLRQQLTNGPRSANAAEAASEAYKEGQADMLAALGAAKDQGIITDDGEGKILDLLGSFVAGAQHAKHELPGGPTGNGQSGPAL